MTYTKPELSGYKAISMIQSSSKTQGNAESTPGFKTTPAYEADE